MTRYFSVLLGVCNGRPCVRVDGRGRAVGSPFRLETYKDGSWTAWYEPAAVPPELTVLGAALADSSAVFGLPTAGADRATPLAAHRLRIAAPVLYGLSALLIAGLLGCQLASIVVPLPILRLAAALSPVLLPIVALLHARQRGKLGVVGWIGLLQVPALVLAGIGATLYLLGRQLSTEPWMRPIGVRIAVVGAAAFLIYMAYLSLYAASM